MVSISMLVNPMTAVKSSKLVMPTLMVGIIALSQRCHASTTDPRGAWYEKHTAEGPLLQYAPDASIAATSTRRTGAQSRSRSPYDVRICISEGDLNEDYVTDWEERITERYAQRRAKVVTAHAKPQGRKRKRDEFSRDSRSRSPSEGYQEYLRWKKRRNNDGLCKKGFTWLRAQICGKKESSDEPVATEVRYEIDDVFYNIKTDTLDNFEKAFDDLEEKLANNEINAKPAFKEYREYWRRASSLMEMKCQRYYDKKTKLDTKELKKGEKVTGKSAAAAIRKVRNENKVKGKLLLKKLYAEINAYLDVTAEFEKAICGETGTDGVLDFSSPGLLERLKNNLGKILSCKTWKKKALTGVFLAGFLLKIGFLGSYISQENANLFFSLAAAAKTYDTVAEDGSCPIEKLNKYGLKAPKRRRLLTRLAIMN